MPWSPQPPRDFQCPYRDGCPYLDGLSTKWVLGQFRRSDDVYREHMRIIDQFDAGLKERDNRIRDLERENAELKAKLRSIHQRQFMPNGKRAAPDTEASASSAKGGWGQTLKRTTKQDLLDIRGREMVSFGS